jgi:gamma-glutamylcyclotransferase (GGCT)/AIG2-like uncharacterized protein YtfP
LVFVYGTLKPGFRYYLVAQQAGAFTQQPGWLEGFELYHLSPENYPALRPGQGRVYGWCYRYEDIERALPVLDALEGVHCEPPEYYRVQVRCQPSGEVAWVYLYRDLARLASESARRVESGNWQPEAEGGRLPRGLT